MTCRMAAIQQKKRVAGSGIHDEYRGKRKVKLESDSDSIVTLKSHIDLKWNGVQKKVLPKKEQVGISWSNLSPYIDSSSRPRSGLADVVYVPKEIFDLEDLSKVLSYEVWDSCLTEAERKFLTQFLPSQLSPEENVCQLLDGENFHFGNPFLKWSAMLCSGNLHPDAVLHAEQEMRANKTAYCTQITTYHKDMLEELQKWKERWLSCHDPETFLRDSPKLKDEPLNSLEENFAESRDLRKRGSLKATSQNNEATNYMSCIKVSRAQFDLIKGMKHSAEGIQAKLLKRVLGDVENYHVQEYLSLNEEEELKLHEHWSKVVCKNLPVALEVWKGRKLFLERVMKSLVLEIAEKTTLIMDGTGGSQDEAEQSDSIRNSDSLIEQMEEDDDIENKSTNLESEVEYSEDEEMRSGSEQNFSQGAEDQDVDGVEYSNTSIEDHRQLEDVVPSASDHVESDTLVVNLEEPEHIEMQPSASDHAEPATLGIDLEETEHIEMPLANNSSTLSKSAEENAVSDNEAMETNDAGNHQEWQPTSPLEPFYCPENQLYPQSGSLALRQPLFPERLQPCVTGLDDRLIGQDREAPAAAAFGADNSSSLFHPSSGQEQDGQIGILSKDPEIAPSSYALGHMGGLKQGVVGMPHLTSHNQFTNVFPEQKQLLDHRNRTLYAQQQLMSKTVYTPNRFSNQASFSLVEQQPNYAARPSGGGSYNWFPVESQSHGWSGLDSVNSLTQCSGSNSDGSLFSVLSQCNQVQSHPELQPTAPVQYMDPKNFMLRAENAFGYARNAYLVPHGALPMNGGSSQATPQNLATNMNTASVDPSSANLQWVNIPQHNSGLPNPMSRQYHGPWGR